MFGRKHAKNTRNCDNNVVNFGRAGPFPLNYRQPMPANCMDSLVLVEAITTVMGYEEKELCKPGRLALAVMLGAATTILGSKKRVSRSAARKPSKKGTTCANSSCCFAGLRTTDNGLFGRESVRAVLRTTVVREIGRLRGDTISVHENVDRLGVQASVHVRQSATVRDDGFERRGEWLQRKKK